MSSKIYFLCLILIVSLLLSINCQKLEKGKRVEKLQTKIEFDPIQEHRGEGDARIEVYIKSNIGQPTAKLNFKFNDVANSTDLVLEEENIYSCTIPHLGKGTVVSYFLEITTATGSKMFLPKNAEKGEDLQTAEWDLSKKNPKWVRCEVTDKDGNTAWTNPIFPGSA